MFSPASAITPPSTPEHEDRQRDIEQGNQRDQLPERADAVLPDRIGHGAEHAERGEPHDQPHRPEQHGRDGVDQRSNALALFAADQSEADAEDDGEKQHLQHVVTRQRVERGGRDDVDEEAADAAALQLVGIVGIGIEGLGIERRRIDVHAVAGTEQIGQHQADDQRDRRHDLEIDQCLDADPADLFEVAGAGDAMHDHAEHDRRHDHRDQLQKGVAEDLEADGKIRNGHPEHNPEQQRRQNLNKQRGIQRLSRNCRSSGYCRHRTLPSDGSKRRQQQLCQLSNAVCAKRMHQKLRSAIKQMHVVKATHRD
jgi:hypothetical protein